MLFFIDLIMSMTATRTIVSLQEVEELEIL